MKFSKCYLKLLTLAIASVLVDGQTTTTPATDLTSILWSLSPCQSAFWIPSTSSELAQSWITYQYEGNPLSQFGECLFTLESDASTRIEMVIQEVHLFDNGVTTPPPCLNLYNVQADGTIVLSKTECSSVLLANMMESVSTFTDTNLAIISTTIRYGSFQLQARAVPLSLGTPPTVSTTTTVSPTTGTTPTTTTSTTPSTSSTTTSTTPSTNSSTTSTTPSTNSTTTSTTPSTNSTTTSTTPSTNSTTTTTMTPTSVTTQNTTTSTNSFRISSDSIYESPASLTVPIRKIGQPRVFVRMVSELNEKHQ